MYTYLHTKNMQSKPEATSPESLRGARNEAASPSPVARNPSRTRRPVLEPAPGFGSPFEGALGFLGLALGLLKKPLKEPGGLGFV